MARGSSRFQNSSSRGRGRGGGGRGRGRGRGRGASHGASRGRGRARTAAPSHQRNGFQTSRVQEDGEASDQEQADSPDDLSEDENLDDLESQSGSGDEESMHRRSYATLLQALNADKPREEPPHKKRRTELESHTSHSTGLIEITNGDEEQEQEEVEIEVDAENAGLAEVVENDDVESVDSDDEEVLLQDPFENHYASVEEMDLKQAIRAVEEGKKIVKSTISAGQTKKAVTNYSGVKGTTIHARTEKDLHLKQRISTSGSKIIATLQSDETDLAGEMFSYRDIQYGHRTVENAPRLRSLASLHAYNHVIKTRDRVIKNNAKLSQQQHEGKDDDTMETRDQGFTRPKVLIITPTKQSCVRFVQSIVDVSNPEQQENKARFLDTYSRDDEDETWENKPEDFQELFGGNNEEDFRVGMKFTRKTVKYFSGFYNSDIIFGSALGLMRTITSGGGKTSKSKDKKEDDTIDNKQKHDADFLTSIEVLIIDHASAIQMQNFQHLTYVLTQLNLLPKQSHDTDFSRVRNWYLDGHARYLRQTILFTSFHTPEINSLFSNHTNNINGLAKYTPNYAGAMTLLPANLLHNLTSIPQTFLRINSPTPQTDSDTRFKYFTTTILPPILRHPSSNKGTLIFIPQYVDFTRLRNYLSTSSSTTNLSFGSISEYTPIRDVARSRSHFMNAKHTVLLYTERAHHHFRYRIKGVRRVIFYGAPDNHVFWPEIVGLLGLSNFDVDVGGANNKNGHAQVGNGGSKSPVRALFSKWDVMKLERIVGSERVGRLIRDSSGDTFEFL